MNQQESFSFLFTDSFYSNLVISPSREFALDVMRIIGGYDLSIVLIIASLAAGCAAFVNYIFGIVLYNIYSASSDQAIKTRYEKFLIFFKKYGILLLIISSIPHVGKFIVLLAGFTRFGIIRCLLIALPCKIAYFIYILYI